MVALFLGIGCAYWAARLPRTVKGVPDVVLTLPMVLPLRDGKPRGVDPIK